MSFGIDKNFVPLCFPCRSQSQEKQRISNSTSKMARHGAILCKHPQPRQTAQSLGSAQLLLLNLHKNFPVEVVSLKNFSASPILQGPLKFPDRIIKEKNTKRLGSHKGLIKVPVIRTAVPCYCLTEWLASHLHVWHNVQIWIQMGTSSPGCQVTLSKAYSLSHKIACCLLKAFHV